MSYGVAQTLQRRIMHNKNCQVVKGFLFRPGGIFTSSR